MSFNLINTIFVTLCEKNIININNWNDTFNNNLFIEDSKVYYACLEAI